MKKLNVLILMAVAMMLTACQNENLADEIIPTSVNSPIKTLGAALNTDPETRAQIVLGNTAETEKVFWNEGDKFTVFVQKNGELKRAEFSIADYYNESSQSSAANFTTDADFLEAGDEVVAIYPAPKTINEDGTIDYKFDTEINMISGAPDEWKEYFSKNIHMRAAKTLESENDNLSFDFMNAFFRITYTNNTGEEQRISNVKISTIGDNYTIYFSKRTGYNPFTEEWNLTTQLTKIEEKFSNLSIPAGESKDFYFITADWDDGFCESQTSIKIEITANNVTAQAAPLPLALIAAKNNGHYVENGKRYWFNISHNIDKDLAWPNTAIETTTGTIENTSFISAVENMLGVTFVKNGNNFVDVSNMHNYSIIAGTDSLDLNNCGLASLAGIEHFRNLAYLSCSDNALTELNLYENIHLRSLNCSNNQLSELDLSKQTQLESLICNNNRLDTLSVIAAGLHFLDCSNNELTSIDLSAYNNRDAHNISLSCYSNHLSTLNFAALHAFKTSSYIACGNQTDLNGKEQTLYLNIRLNDTGSDAHGHAAPSQIGIWDKCISDPLNAGVVVEGYSPSGSINSVQNGGIF